MDSRPILSEVSHDFGGFSVSRLQVKAGPVARSPLSQLRIVANFDARWETSIDGGNTYQQGRGEICVLPPNLQRQTKIREAGEGLLISVNERMIDRLAAEVGNSSPWGGFRFEKLNDPVVNRLLLILGNEFKSDGFRSAIFVESVVTTLLGYLLRSEHRARDASAIPGGLTAMQLQRCQQYIEANIADNITINVLARTAGLSPYYFIRAFKRSTGLTPHQSVLEARVRNAQALLMNSTLSIGEIARSVGFLSAGLASAPPRFHLMRSGGSKSAMRGARGYCRTRLPVQPVFTQGRSGLT
jgi:AraC family transcriptional regulator